MFRESVLVNKEVIDKITDTMIPLALNFETVMDPRSKEARFLQPMIKPGRNRRLSNETDQGIWILSPEGKLLGNGFSGWSNWVPRTKRLIDRALKSFGPVKRRRVKVVETHPYRGKGVMSDGSVRLAQYVRADKPAPPANISAPVISSVTLTQKEFKAFAPRKAVRGAKWKLPNAVAKKLCRLTSPACYQHAPQPEWVTGVRIDARVRKSRGGVAWLSYEGTIEVTDRRLPVKNGSTVKLTGEGVYDIKAGRMRSLRLVGSGTGFSEEFPGRTDTFQALIEWAGK